MKVYHHLEGWTFIWVVGGFCSPFQVVKKNVFKFFFLHSLSKKWFSTLIDIFGNTHKHTQTRNKIGNLPYLFTTNFINPWVGVTDTTQTHTHTHTYLETHTFIYKHTQTHTYFCWKWNWKQNWKLEHELLKTYMVFYLVGIRNPMLHPCTINLKLGTKLETWTQHWKHLKFEHKLFRTYWKPKHFQHELGAP